MREPRNRVVQLKRFGSADELEVVDAPMPAARTGEVRVRVLAPSVEYTDVVNVANERPLLSWRLISPSLASAASSRHARARSRYSSDFFLFIGIDCPATSLIVLRGTAAYQETTVRTGTKPPPPFMSTPLFGPPGAAVDTDHAVVIAAAAMMIAMVTIFRMSLLHRSNIADCPETR